MACPLGQVPAGAWCLGSPVLRPHGRVLQAAVSAPLSKGGFTQQGWLVQVRAGAWCLGSLVLCPHGRVLPAALSGTPSKGVMYGLPGALVTGVAAC